MKKAFFLFAIILFTFAVSAQVDLSGSWKLNTSKSKLGDQFSMAPKEIIIVQNGNNMSVEKHSEFQGQEFNQKDNYTLDGKECENDGFMDSKKKSTVTWAADKKSLTVVSKIPMQDQEITTTEVYKLDGGNMVIESKMGSPMGDMNETQVYDKK